MTGGTTYLVGERGPELFTPQGSGQIVPNHQLGGGGMGGGVSRVLIELGEGLEGRILEAAGSQTVQLVRAYDRTALPDSVGRVNRDPRRRG